MKEEQFIKANSSTWRELEDLSKFIARKGIRALPSKDIKKFLYVFRQSSHHLAYARTHYPGSSSVSYLNSLISRCHSYVYSVKRTSPKQLLSYILYDFPLILMKYRWYIISSFAFFAAGALISLLLVLYNPDSAAMFLPQYLVEGIKSGQAGGGEWNHPLMSSYIMVNNIGVSLKAFVYGITLGLGTIYVLFLNGMVLGSLTALIYLYSEPVGYWSLILPHGIIELTAIFISGAAGLIIAKSILLPGEYSRKHALIDGAKKAVTLVMGVILMLIIAGIIEGFFTPLGVSNTVKLSFAAITAVILSAYFSIPYFVKKQ